MTPSVFISHSHADRAVAAEIDLVLRKNGAQTFLDQRELGPGDQLPANLQASIENCSSFLLLWSVSAGLSTWVKREWNLAYTKQKRIIPFTVDGFALPSPLNNFISIGGVNKFE
jgi:TIR domain